MQSKKLNILLIDDDQHQNLFFDDALKTLRINYNLLYSTDALASVNKLLSEDINLIFLDINMPRMSGLQFLKEIKTHEVYHSIPVIIHSITARTIDIEESYKNGAHYFLVKPYSMMNIIESLKIIFKIDWRTPPPRPPFDKFVVNLAYA